MLLCCGESLIDMIPAQGTEGEAAFSPLSGGAIFNTAIALGRLGKAAGLMTGLSSDLFGKQLEAALTESGVDTGYAIRSGRPTTLAFVSLKDGHATYVFYDENTAGRMIRPEDLPALGESVSTLYFGGISLAVEPCADTYAALLTREAATRVIMIDPNIRPGFIADEARYRGRLKAMIAQSDIVKVSDEDLTWMDAGPAPIEDKARALLAAGPSLVIVTRGKEGAIALTASGVSIEVAGRPVTVVDTVGAGDTFNAGVLASLSDQGLLTKDKVASLSPDALKAALELGAQVAAITVSRAGANPPWASELGA
ncbi:carbohydrate kinase family protein [Roseibium aestuarii]|uniref:Carbohydrate kinase n=1 Tax=Roseibium aestuarii TaxID=2600299 RepID=A0ABW4JX65_9HYPH|nr:carbohydrate kinase [Roseibium aestuarii]